MKKLVLILLVAATTILFGFRQQGAQEVGLKLPVGFSAQIFADDVGRARHLVVTPKGHVYVKLSRLEDVLLTIEIQIRLKWNTENLQALTWNYR